MRRVCLLQDPSAFNISRLSFSNGEVKYSALNIVKPEILFFASNLSLSAHPQFGWPASLGSKSS